MNKNLVIFALIVLTVSGSIWGSVANKKKVSLERELTKTVAELKQLRKQSARDREQVLGKTAGIQEDLNSKEDQLVKARKELVDLRKATQSFEAKISGCTASIQKSAQEKAELLKKLQSAEKKIAGLKIALQEQKSRMQSTAINPAESEAVIQAQQVEIVNTTLDQLQQQLNAANAQVVGLEKIVDEKNAALAEAVRKIDRMKINRDVLLSKILEQRNGLQKLQDEKGDLAKKFASQSEKMATMQKKTIQNSVQ